MSKFGRFCYRVGTILVLMSIALYMGFVGGKDPHPQVAFLFGALLMIGGANIAWMTK